MPGGCEHWCHVYDGVVHAGTYSNGQMHTYTIDDDGDTICYFVADGVPFSECRPWRDRKMFRLPVCAHCEAEVADMIESFERAVTDGFFDDLELLG